MSGWGYFELLLVDGDWVLCMLGGVEVVLIVLDKCLGEEIWSVKIDLFGDGKNKNNEEL